MYAFTDFLFYLVATSLLVSALGVITLRNPIHCALLLVLSFVFMAVLWMLLGAEFLAWVLVLVYVGAVMVLFLFVVMMLDINLDKLKEGFWRYSPIGIGVILVLGGQVILIVNSGVFDLKQYPEPRSAVVEKGYSHAKALGEILYTDFLLAFETAAAILLVAIVAAIALTMRKRKENKHMDPADQVVVKASDRLSMVQVELEQPVEPEVQEELAEADPKEEKKS